ncbi:Gfo/Idh/MocA family oxidoreductase [Streptomyces sp. SL13]|uniref:Gfo/Idh/MocA family oxidoreductase n=1 Tax=Streptantibioticus silvisoli TaxID=2705255 RepID=A0AA90H6F1_9ACTN|nr:Gfo/Idh/MocA family oxidoreductase [Streptantibioticus silvisoli]MDI5974424.1 Gfo/Idh/MocA family oxidoreductase [Streptantibioticus silvisoli]
MRIGLLGTGPWAHLAYAPALSAHPDVEFTGVWGRRPQAARELAQEFGTEVFEDADALIDACEAVAIALPPAVQAPLAVRAAERGRHLLLDKPLAASVDGARSVVDAVSAAGVASVVFFTLRFTDPAAAWIEQQAAAGEWFTARADYFGDVFTGSGSPFADSPWRAEKGGLWDVGPHALSVLLPVLGDVTDVTAAHGPADAVHLVLRHEGGASSTAALTLRAPTPAAGVVVELRGGHGVVALPQSADGGPVRPLGRAVDALLESARTGEPHTCDVRFAARVVEILAAAEQALDGGR